MKRRKNLPPTTLPRMASGSHLFSASLANFTKTNEQFLFNNYNAYKVLNDGKPSWFNLGPLAGHACQFEILGSTAGYSSFSQ